MSEIKNVGQTWMTKCNQLTALPFKGLMVVARSHVGVRCVHRCWRQLVVHSFRRDLQHFALVINPPSNVDDFFTCYDKVLRSGPD